MNAAMSASVVLASRLRDDISVFALMLFSIQMFALLPILRMRLLVSLASFGTLLGQRTLMTVHSLPRYRSGFPDDVFMHHVDLSELGGVPLRDLLARGYSYFHCFWSSWLAHMGSTV